MLCTSIFIAFTCFVAIIYPKISSVLGILGGLNATAIQFLVPSKKYIFPFIPISSDLLC